MEIVNLQTQKSIAKPPQAVVDTGVDLFPHISKLTLFCDSQWLLHVQPAFISLSFSW